MTEFNLDAASVRPPTHHPFREAYTPYFDSSDVSRTAYYDISNIEGFSVGQQIQAEGGETVTCASVLCDCTQAYAPGSTLHTFSMDYYRLN